jgi:hypothetical protein
VRVRGWVVVVLGLLLAAACGDGAPTIDEAADDATEDTTDDATDDAAGPQLSQPSLLDAIADLGSHGTFVVEGLAPDQGEGIDGVTGRYLTVEGSPTLTVVDLDLDLVRTEIDELLARLGGEAGVDPLFADAVLSERTTVTDRLQLGLSDVLLLTGAVGDLGFLALEPSLAFTVAGDDLTDDDLPRCTAAFAALRDAVEGRVLDALDELDGDWQPDADELAGDEVAEVERACDPNESFPATSVALERDERSVSISVDGHSFLTVRVDPGAGEAPDADGPVAPLLDKFGAYFVAIDRCGGLPHLYSNFAAANSYTAPDEPSYLGPTPFGEQPVCAEDVPD